MTRALLLSLVLVGGVGCSSSKAPPSSNQPSPSGTGAVMNQEPTPSLSGRCTTEAEVRAKLGNTCTVVGTYELKEIPNKKGGPWRNWPVVLLDGDQFVALESVWDESKMPAADEVAKWRGKKVAVTGMLHGQPPHDSPANMSMLTIAPVESIEVVP